MVAHGRVAVENPVASLLARESGLSTWEATVLGYGSTSFTAEIERIGGRGSWERMLGINSKESLLGSMIAQPSVADTLAARTGLDAVLFRTPNRDEIRSLAEQALAATNWKVEAILGADLLSAQVRGAFDAIQTPWLHDQHALMSARSMAELQVLGLAARDAPFTTAAVDTLRARLGDWRDPIAVDPLWTETPRRLELYASVGLDRGLAAFPELAFERGLDLAGLPAVTDDHDEDESATEDGDTEELAPDYRRAQAAFPILQRFELEVRAFISLTMESTHGTNWVRTNVPGPMRDQWVARRAAAEHDGAASRPLHEYADFTDYKVIIEKGDNWTAAFKWVFGRQEDVRESFQRLFPLRIATMHARGLSQEDVLLLRVETGRILRAIRRASES